MQSANIREQPERLGAGQSTLLSPAGITSAATVDKIYRLGAQFGGPIKQDKIWFFTAIARWGSTVQQPSAYYNPLQDQAGIAGAGVVPNRKPLQRHTLRQFSSS